jgi:NADH-quinone oxidoreductase subunit C
MQALREKIESLFEGVDIRIADDYRMIINMDSKEIISMLSYLKTIGYNHLALVSCVDLIDQNKFELVYILSAYMESDDRYTEKEKLNIIVKTKIPRDKPEFITVIDIFENAEPYERELHELFGVYFEGHPRLTPLFLELKYEKPPFRKDFDTVKFSEEYFGSIPPVE